MPYHPQSANRLTERIHAVVRSIMERANLSQLVIACSGGADSTCLAHAVAAVMHGSGGHVTICHVQHHFRTDDEKDALVVRAMAKTLGAPFHLVCLPVAQTDSTHHRSEGEMRDLRYCVLAAVATEACADAVLTGHTLDDQAETVLLHLVRGAGLDGLGGMSEDTQRMIPDILAPQTEARTDGQRIRIVRPLLSVRHEETVAYCDAHNLAIIHDPTNDNQTYSRNWMRHVIVPALRERNPDVVSVLARTAAHVHADADFLVAEAMTALARCDCRSDAACVSLRAAAFASEHVAMQRRMLRHIFVQVTGDVPRASIIDAAQRHASATRSSAIRTFGVVVCALAFDRIVFGAKADVIAWISRAAAERYPLAACAQRMQTNQTIQLSLTDASVAQYGLRIVAVPPPAPQRPHSEDSTVFVRLPRDHWVEIRNRLPGDRFWPVGRAHTVSLSDYLATRDVPAPVRDLLPLLVVNDTIAWVIGHDSSAEFAATAATATHCCLLIRKNTPARERIGTTHG